MTPACRRYRRADLRAVPALATEAGFEALLLARPAAVLDALTLAARVVAAFAGAFAQHDWGR